MTPQFAAETRAVVLPISDRCHRGQQNDLSGPAVARLLHEAGIDAIDSHILPDELDDIVSALHLHAQTAQLIVTTGGTGLAPRDVTPEATRLVCDRLVEGLSELMRTGLGLCSNAPSPPSAAPSAAPSTPLSSSTSPAAPPEPRLPSTPSCPSSPMHSISWPARTSHDYTGDISYVKHAPKVKSKSPQ